MEGRVEGGRAGEPASQPASERVGPSGAKFASTLAVDLKELFI